MLRPSVNGIIVKVILNFKGTSGWKLKIDNVIHVLKKYKSKDTPMQ